MEQERRRVGGPSGPWLRVGEVGSGLKATSVAVYQGSDYAQSTGTLGYAFLDYTAHPGYDGQTSSPNDIAVVRVLGVDATTPVVPMLAPDTLTSSQRVTSVGFGRTIRPNVRTDAASNTAKNRIDGAIARLTATQIGVRYDNDGDICQGDSGGPVMVTVAGKEFVAGVHSFVTGPCVGVGYSVRGSAHAAFVRSVLGQATPQTCDSCRRASASGTQVCAEARRACLADAQCNGLRLCLDRCVAVANDAGAPLDGGAADDCRKACAVEFPFGAAPYNTQINFCSCNACESACAGESVCAAVPTCGMKFDSANDTCSTCMDGACCAEEEACGKDGHCYRCVRPPETSGCSADPLYTRLQACRASRCGSQCP